ncbi:hypothetical protein AG1IA_02272 [Rhizoctonia solani AG-1 IA]|uniref:Uncharacterized protein n=1 Tax=Thanatephorus cucumeris (strain AG1-IA) TaxID=983506 RepID=L8X4Z8_THACA|nr:hypothetical protein AG1IA_02272 [Rhizoctonia solani AG-1 IA]
MGVVCSMMTLIGRDVVSAPSLYHNPRPSSAFGIQQIQALLLLATMPSTSLRTTSDASRQKPKNKGKVVPQVTSGKQPQGADSTAVVRQPSPISATPKKSKAKNKAKKKEKKPHKTSIFDRLVQLILLGYLLFTVQQCHNDVDLKSPVCKAVQQRILQPLVYQPYNFVVTHPSVAPVLEASKPYRTQAVKASQPLVQAAQKLYIVRVAPHVAQLEKRTRPYVRNLKFHYARNVAPVVRTIQIYYTQLQNTLEPYINQAIAALIRLWLEVQPKLIPLIEESKFIPEWMREHVLIPLMRLRGRTGRIEGNQEPQGRTPHYQITHVEFPASSI